MKLLVQDAQPVTGGGDSNSAGPALELEYDHQHLNTILISIATRIQTQLDYLFYQLKPGANTRSESSLYHTQSPGLCHSRDNSLLGVSAGPQLCAHNQEKRGASDICRTGHRQSGGWSANEPKALLDRVLHDPGLG